MSRLAGKTALVTGGGSGIGLAVARQLLQEGAQVAISGRDAAKLERAAADLKGGERLLTHACDVSDVAQVKALVDRVRGQWGRIDILVNNAGTNLKKRMFRELTIEGWNQLVRTNLDGAFYCIHHVLPEMLERHDGNIVNISSVAGKRGFPLGGVAYAASKFGVTGMGMALGAEEKDSGVRFCNIYPGEVDTPILEHRPSPLTEEHRQSILQPEDVAAAVIFVVTLPARVSVPELIIKPANQQYI